MTEQILDALYQSEINVRLSSFYDGGWAIEFGDILNGFKEPLLASNAELCSVLMQGAFKYYPDSDFTKEFKDK